jgi:hypothetical protein
MALLEEDGAAIGGGIVSGLIGGRASIEIDGQRIPLSPEGFAKLRTNWNEARRAHEGSPSLMESNAPSAML